MPIIQTPNELGLAIRSRRKELGWDQATLAKQVGVTRQWVIDIEKGKPRAELALAMRALRVLGLSLNVEAKPESGGEREAAAGPPNLDINAIVERNRAIHSTASAGAVADYLKQLKPARKREQLGGFDAARSVADALGGTAASRLANLMKPKLPKTAADYLKELAESRSVAGFDAIRKSVDPLGEAAAASRLADLASPKLPRTIADEVRELEAARRLDTLGRAARAGSSGSAGSKRKADDSAGTKPVSKRPRPKKP